jgi:hypothetical protein
MEPARQAKRKEADATGPQGGYGIRLACSDIRAKGMPNKIQSSFFFIHYVGEIFTPGKSKINTTICLLKLLGGSANLIAITPVYGPVQYNLNLKLYVLVYIRV